MTTLSRKENIADSRHKLEREKERENIRITHTTVFQFASFLHGIGSKKSLQSLRSHYLENGMTPQVHGNTQRLPYNALPFVVINAAVKFLLNYAEQHIILLSGRIPGYKNGGIKLLPSSSSKMVHTYIPNHTLYVVLYLFWKV